MMGVSLFENPGSMTQPAETILDFCATCGALLHEGEGLKVNPSCHVCHNSVRYRDQRIQGIFSPSDALKLRQAQNREEEE